MNQLRRLVVASARTVELSGKLTSIATLSSAAVPFGITAYQPVANPTTDAEDASAALAVVPKNVLRSHYPGLKPEERAAILLHCLGTYPELSEPMTVTALQPAFTSDKKNTAQNPAYVEAVLCPRDAIRSQQQAKLLMDAVDTEAQNRGHQAKANWSLKQAASIRLIRLESVPSDSLPRRREVGEIAMDALRPLFPIELGLTVVRS